MQRINDRLGGPDEVVKIDGSELEKRKYNKGRVVEGQRVLGGVERYFKHPKRPTWFQSGTLRHAS